MVEALAVVQKRKGAIFGLAFLIAVAVVIEVYAVGNGLSYRELIVAFAALAGGIVVFGKEWGIRFGFVLWALMMALGYRTLSVTPELAIHPAEVLLWLLLACILVQRDLLADAPLGLPIWVMLFVPFWVLAWWPLIAGDAQWDTMLNEFRNFFLLLPLLVVAPVVLQRGHYWRPLVVAFFIAGTWIALMGIIEYRFPDVTRLIPAFVSKTALATMTPEGFSRAQFSFYGGPLATFVNVLTLPLAIVIGEWWRNMLPRVAIALASLSQIYAIYIGGYRSIWLILLIQVVIACVLRLRKHGVAIAFLCLAIGIGGYQFIPNTTNERVMSGIAALRGRPTDHSAQDRKNRAMGAFSSAFENPLGGGWGKAGWVHSDFIQIAANLGLIAGLIFFGGYVYTLLRMLRRVQTYLKAGKRGDLGFSLLLSFVGVGGLLMMEGVSVLPQLVLPSWLIWVVVEVWLRQTPETVVMNVAVAPVYSNQLTPLEESAGYSFTTPAKYPLS